MAGIEAAGKVAADDILVRHCDGHHEFMSKNVLY